jgi:hypothetical protein
MEADDFWPFDRHHTHDLTKTSLMEGNALLVSTNLTIDKEGWPKRACHRE